jgi:hypothetical protein
VVYQPNIPQPTDQISQSQGDILGNFQALDPFINGIFNLPPQGSPPAGTGNNIIYAMNYLGTQQVFIQNAAGTTNIPITAQFVAGNAGWTYLPSGMLICWNQGTILAGNPTATVVFATVPSFPGFTTSSLNIQITRVNNATSTNFTTIASFTQLQFVAQRSTNVTGSNDVFSWLAIGL